MYKLMLVDDKPGVIDGLRKLGRWEELSVTLSGEAFDGAMALELAMRDQPDIVLTDIHMPIMDGLEFARRLLEVRPRTKIILLTGYDDFEYARTALRLGAVEFLTKPSTLEEIRAAVGRAVVLLDGEQARTAELEELRQRVQESLPLLRQEYLSGLLQGRLPAAEPDLPSLLSFAAIPLTLSHPLAVICFDAELQPSGGPAAAELTRMALTACVEAVLADSAWAVARGRDGNPVAVGSLPEQADGRTVCIQAAERVLLTAGERHLSASAGVGRMAASVHDLPRAYTEAHTALQHRFFVGPGAVIHIDDLCPGGFGPISYPSWAEEQIALGLRAGAEDQVADGLKRFFDHIAAGTDRQEAFRFCQELTAVMARVIRELCSGADPHMPQAPVLEGLTSAAAYREALEQWLQAAARVVGTNRQSRQTDVVGCLRSYIGRNLSGDCSLQALAEHVHLSPTYLAQLFKRQTGQTVLEYVTAAKMERVKLLLATTDEKVAAICDELGYGDRRHFVDLFRRVTGMTPTEYREQFRSGAEK